MINVLKIKLDRRNLDKGSIYHSFGSLFQGFLIEQLSYEYAEKLHSNGIRPYSQYVINENDAPYWVINTLNEEAYEEIIKPLLSDNINSIYLKQKELKINIVGKEIVERLSYDELIRKVYIDDTPSRYFTINFLTPTSFKSNGEYLIFPKLDNILFSLISKYDYNTSAMKLYDEEVFNEILERIRVVNYKLNSTKFHLEGTSIPSFRGNIVISIRGNDTIKRLINLILIYGKYSGIGIKTAIGMGAINIS